VRYWTRATDEASEVVEELRSGVPGEA